VFGELLHCRAADAGTRSGDDDNGRLSVCAVISFQVHEKIS
jgi:hypothetical protein